MSSFPEFVYLHGGIQYVVDQTQKYDLGTRGVSPIPGDCRVWRYTYLSTINSHGSAAGGNGLIGLGVFSKAVHEAVTIVTATAGTDRVTGTIAGVTANEFQGGLICIDGSATNVTLGIKENTATDDPASGQASFLLEGNLRTTFISSDTCTVIPGPYANVVTSNGSRGSTGYAFESCVGFITAGWDKDGTALADGDYMWVQTWGPCYTWASATYEGGSTGERNCRVYADGAVQVTNSSNLNPSFQFVGNLYTTTQATAGVGGAGTDVTLPRMIVFLQIAP
jgi:hypothetical protein